MGTRARRYALCLALFAGPGCGYHATPVDIELFPTASGSSGQGPLKTMRLRGVADPDGSDFDSGFMISTRWGASRDNVHIVELFVDIDRGLLPNFIEPPSNPAVLRLEEGDVTVRVPHRGADGSVLFEPSVDGAEIQVGALKQEGARELSTGSFDIELSGDGLYSRLQGTWQTRPRPSRAVIAGGDYGGGDTSTSGDTDQPPGDEDIGEPVEIDSSGGCSCAGDEGEDLPEEEPEEEEPPPEEEEDTSDSGGCDCQGDEGGEEEEEDTSDSGGCDCQGDEGGEEEEPEETEPEPDASEDEESSGGCDCQGDDPEEPTDETFDQLGLGASGAKPCNQAEHTRKKRPKRRKARRRRCKRAPLRVALELSPILFVYVVSRRRRRPQG